MKRAILYIFLTVCSVCMYAIRTAPVKDLPQQEYHSQCILTSGAPYKSDIYEPFTSTTPSEQTSGRTYKPQIRKGFDTGASTEQGPSPVGEPWILALFAALFAGIIAWKKRTFHGTITGPSPENNPK